MKKVHLFIIIYVVFIIFLSISISKTLAPKKLGEIYSYLYEALDNNFKKIEANMDEITISNDEFDWAELKEINTKDEQLKHTYGLLVSDIRSYYLFYSDLNNETNNNINLLSYEDKINISKKELRKLTNNNDYLNKFDKYNSMDLSDDQIFSDRIKAQINIIIDYNKDNYAYKDFEQLLYDELVTTSKIASLSSWLKTEYYSNLE